MPQNSTATEVIDFGWPNNGSVTGTVSGTVITGDVISFVIHNGLLPSGQGSVNYTVMSSEAQTALLQGWQLLQTVTLILVTLGITATSSSANFSILQPSTSYSWSDNSGATESLNFGPTNNGNVEVTVSGLPTSGDMLTIKVNNGAISGGESSSTYTVTANDTLMSIAAGLAAAINADTNLAPLGLTAINSSPGVFRWSQTLTADVPVTSMHRATLCQ